MNKGRKISSGKYHKQRKTKLHERKGQPRNVVLRETKRKKMKGRGGNKKTVLLSTNEINIRVNGKIKKAQIKNVVETPQNIFLARQNRLTKGAIVETTVGKARITNRPSQEGMINAILIEEKSKSL